MAGGNISSEKIDLLIYGPSKPIVDNGFSDQFVLHAFETTPDLERLTPAIAEKIRGAAITYNSVRGDAKTLARFPKLEIISAFGVGYDHVDANYAKEHNIVVTNTPDVLTESVADFTWALILAITRRLSEGERLVRRPGGVTAPRVCARICSAVSRETQAPAPLQICVTAPGETPMRRAKSERLTPLRVSQSASDWQIRNTPPIATPPRSSQPIGLSGRPTAARGSSSSMISWCTASAPSPYGRGQWGAT